MRMSDSSAHLRLAPAEGIRHPNVVYLAKARVEARGDQPAFYVPERGAWRSISWAAWWEDARAAAAGLAHRAGVGPGDRVALMCGVRYEWMVWDLAVSMLGAVVVPIDAAAPTREARGILEHAGCVAAVVEHPDHLRTLSAASGGVECLRVAVYLEPHVDLPPTRGGGRISLEDVHVGGVDVLAAEDLQAGAVEEQGPLGWTESGLETTWSIVYTSGTTGSPRGVVLTHKNLVYEAWAIRNSFAVDHRDVQLAFLPLHHIFARHMLWAAVDSGAQTAFCDDPREVAGALRQVRPTYFGAVPWTFERMRAQVERAVRAEGAVARRQFAWAMEVARRARGMERAGATPSLRHRVEASLADRMVLSPIRERLGARLRFAISGAAPIRVDTLEFFHAIGVLVLEGYGLTETTGATHVNRPNRYRFGTVGGPLPGCEVSLGEDGEVLIRGHHVMRGYFRDAAMTGAALDGEGWLHTGDLGELEGGFLRIVGRKKSIIVTTAGKNISPAPIEQALVREPEIASAVVVGDARPYLAVLIVIDEAQVMARAREAGLGCRGYQDLICHPEVRAWVQAGIDRVNEGRTRAEQLRAFALLPAPLTRERGELTATLKVRRTHVQAIYADLIEATYATASRGAPST